LALAVVHPSPLHKVHTLYDCKRLMPYASFQKLNVPCSNAQRLGWNQKGIDINLATSLAKYPMKQIACPAFDALRLLRTSGRRIGHQARRSVRTSAAVLAASACHAAALDDTQIVDSKLLPASTWRLRASRFEWEAQRSFCSISCTEKKNKSKENFQNPKKNEFKSAPLRLKKEKMPRPFEIMHVKGIELTQKRVYEPRVSRSRSWLLKLVLCFLALPTADATALQCGKHLPHS
jgi:hypothetical protein